MTTNIFPMSNNRTESVTVYFTANEIAYLDQCAQDADRSRSSLIRQAWSAWFNKKSAGRRTRLSEGVSHESSAM